MIGVVGIAYVAGLATGVLVTLAVIWSRRLGRKSTNTDL